MKHVTIVVPDCILNLNSIAGAYEILSKANGFWKKMGKAPKLDIKIAGYVPEAKVEDGYFSIHPTDINTISKTDMVIIPSIFGDNAEAVRNNKQLISWIERQYKAGAEIASICSGAFFLAETGILEGKKCSIHWNSVKEFREMYPGIEIEQDKVITAENGVYTNGGGYSFLNLMLYLVEHFFDRSTAIFCSKIFQIDIERTAQSQFAIFHIQKGHGDELVTKAQVYIEEHLDVKISFEQLAADLSINRRSFDRRFIKATGNTPVEYLQRVKVEAAKKSLETGRKTVFDVMSEVGYSDDKAFREVFKKITGLSPLDYKAKYSKDAAIA